MAERKIIETNLRHPNNFTRRSKTDMVVVHHAAAKSASVETINQWHLNNGWNGIGYHYYIRKNGTIYRGRPEWALGAHAEGSNDRSIGICCEGDYMTETMPEAQLTSLKALLRDIMDRYGKLTLRRHMDVCSTDCPGLCFPWTEVCNYETEENDMTDKQVREIARQASQEVYNELKVKRYKTVEDLPAALQSEIRELISAGALKGQGGDKGLDLTEDMARGMIIGKRYADSVFDGE